MSIAELKHISIALGGCVYGGTRIGFRVLILEFQPRLMPAR